MFAALGFNFCSSCRSTSVDLGLRGHFGERVSKRKVILSLGGQRTVDLIVTRVQGPSVTALDFYGKAPPKLPEISQLLMGRGVSSGPGCWGTFREQESNSPLYSF